MEGIKTAKDHRTMEARRRAADPYRGFSDMATPYDAAMALAAICH
jgi:hypothetical protein